MSYSENRTTASASVASYLPCRACGHATPPAILSQYGALCSTCHHEANASDASARRLSEADKRAVVAAMRDGVRPVNTFKAWAWELKRREEAGDRRLTRFQRDAWRYALSAELRHRVDEALDGAEVSLDDINASLRASGDLEP